MLSDVSYLLIKNYEQIIMCVIFGSCKAEKNEEVTFKRIIQVYIGCSPC